MNNSQHHINHSWLIKEDGRVVYEDLPVNILSICSNFFVIFLCFNSPDLKEHSRYFIANTAFMNIGYAGTVFLWAVNYSLSYIFDMEITALSCTFATTLQTAFGIGTILSYPGTTCCRYNEVLLNKQCCKLVITLLLLYPFVAILYLPGSWTFAHFHATEYEFCRVLYRSKFQLHVNFLGISCVLISCAIQLTLSFKLYKHLKWHFKHISANLHTDNNALRRLKVERSILSAILIQGLAPLILALPIITRNIFIVFHTDFGQTGRNITLFVYGLNPLVDSCAVLFVMIPYAKARRQVTKRLWHKLKNIVRCETNMKAAKETNIS